MIEEIRLPEISEGVETGDVVKVLVAVGDTVDVDQPLVELETEKAVFEVPSTAEGTIAEILVSVGDTVRVGQTLVKIDTEAKGDGATPDETRPESRPAPETPEEAPDEAPDQKKSQAIKEDAGQEPPAPPAEPLPESQEAHRPPVPAAPSVRRLARELGVDIHRVDGSGAGGKISADDVKRFAKGVIVGATGATAPPPTAGAPPLPDFSKWGEVDRQPMSKVRRLTAQSMAAAWTTVPHVTQNDEADITEVENARKRYAKRAEEAGGKLTMTAILLKACAGALRNFPDFNASVDVANGEIIYKKYVNIGVAVDTERGLLVPVIRGVDCKNIIELSVELTDVAERARNKKIMPDEMEGGNFTISNLGGIGGTSFSPIVYAPEVAILGVSRAQRRPVWNGEAFEPRLMLPLSLSYDHRIIDGALAARFARWVCEALEDPVLLALEG
jgi:pyruvate dehydrogenase E2 component (dihydrolipoamide acetyltransferase)